MIVEVACRTEGQAKSILATWKASGVFTEEDYKTPNRHNRKRIVLNEPLVSLITKALSRRMTTCEQNGKSAQKSANSAIKCACARLFPTNELRICAAYQACARSEQSLRTRPHARSRYSALWLRADTARQAFALAQACAAVRRQWCAPYFIPGQTKQENCI